MYGSGWPKNSEKILAKNLKVLKFVAQCRKRVFPYLYTLRRTIAYALSNLLPLLIHAVPILTH